MPSKNRKHFAVIDSDGTVLDSVSSDRNDYKAAIMAPGKKTKWEREYSPERLRTLDAVVSYYEVIETPERLMVGQTSIQVPQETHSSNLIDEAVEWMDEQAPPTKDELTATPKTPEEYHEQMQAARTERVSLADMKTHHDTRSPASKPFKHPDGVTSRQRVYKTGQRWTKPGTGIVARVYLVKEDGRAYARGNRRNLSAILLDDSWELAR